MLKFSICIGCIAVASKFFLLPFHISVTLGCLLYLVTGGWSWVRLLPRTLKRDILYIRAAIFAGFRFLLCMRRDMKFGDIFSEVVRKQPDKLAFVSADTGASLTFGEAEKLGHKIANLFHSLGYRKGDVVVLLMENRIEYVPIWVGLAKIGVVTSLVNYNLRGDSLKHCIDVCKCKALVFSRDMTEAVRDIHDRLDVDLFSYDECENFTENVTYMGSLLKSSPDTPPPRPDTSTKEEIILYMYTSGTTGLPKAAIIRASKCVFFGYLVNENFNLGPDDVIYNALPLYHGNAGLIMACQVIVNGATMVIKKRFSASSYMSDCRKYDVTIVNYIGETCRYLLSQPSNEFDRANKIRIALGNGLRMSIWDEFKNRFDIPLIVEIYGSTEGNIGLMNTVGRRGAVGFTPIIIPSIFPVKLIKVDKDTGVIIRQPNGLAIEAKPGETGLVVGKIRNDNVFYFDGYHDKAETEKKKARDIFVKGDTVFLSGDILSQDEEGFYYFHDRTGDTFRWKGENVSTNEVEGLMSKALQLTDVCVYAAEVPGNEGKAGMACICDPDEKVDLDSLQKALEQSLPLYARPIFLRMTSSLEVTGTYKFRKNKLRDEGFDPSAILKEDKLFYFDCKEKKYLPLDAHAYGLISEQKMRF